MITYLGRSNKGSKTSSYLQFQRMQPKTKKIEKKMKNL